MFWGFLMPENKEIQYIKRTLELASKGRGKTKPNPLVGAVIVKNGKIIGEGYHKGPGKDHAEIAALKDARKKGHSPKNATLYVNLEPCCHTGRTGPCTVQIIEAGINRVVSSTKDPNPLVNGKGFKKLKKNKIEITNNVLKSEASKLNEVYFTNINKKRPFVILKLAQSLDGNIATHKNNSKYISSKSSLKFVHKLRSELDAVMIGGNTARIDNPKLNVRFTKGVNPYRIIVSTKSATLEKLNLIKENKDYKTILLSDKTSRNSKLIYWDVKKRNRKIDLQDLLDKAFAFGINSIMVEGGSKLAGEMLKEKLIDKIIIISAPILLGDGVSSITNFKPDFVNDGLNLKDLNIEKSESDLIITAYPEYRI